MSSVSTLLSTLRSGQFWYLFPHYFYRWRRNREMERTTFVSTTSFGERTDVPELHVLTGASSIGDLLYAAKSFITQYQNPLTLVIHGDGTLNEPVIQRLQRHLPNARVFSKEERDKKTIPYLETRDFQNCMSFREANVFGERLVDTAVLSEAETVINMDTDCLSFAPLDHLQSLVEQQVAAHVRDPQSRPFSISDEDARDRFGVEPVRHFNAGLCAFPQDRLDLERIEEWLSPPGYPMETHYAEQTLLGALAATGPSQALPQETYGVGRMNVGKDPAFIHYAAHYLSETRIAMRRDGQKRVLRQLQTHS